MTIQGLSVVGIEALNELIDRVKADLFDQANVQFFTMGHTDEPRQRNVNNRHLLKLIGQQAGVYAIWIQQGQERPLIRYVGQTAGKTARQRIKNHFIGKHKETGAKLELVNIALEQGYRVGFSYVIIEPSAIRHCVEEILINQLDDECWNKHSRLTIKAAIR